MLPLFGGLLALMLLSAGKSSGTKRRPSPSPPSPSVPPGPPDTTDRSAFVELMGRLAYRSEIALRIIDALLYKIVVPTDQPFLAMVHPAQAPRWASTIGVRGTGFDRCINRGLRCGCRRMHTSRCSCPGRSFSR